MSKRWVGGSDTLPHATLFANTVALKHGGMRLH